MRNLVATNHERCYITRGRRIVSNQSPVNAVAVLSAINLQRTPWNRDLHHNLCLRCLPDACISKYPENIEPMSLAVIVERL